MQTARVIIVDRDRSACRALRRKLKIDPRLQVVAETCSVREALAQIATHLPDVVVVADWLSGLRGLILTSTLGREWPEIGTVALVERLDVDAWVAAVEAGAAGIVARRAPDDEMLHTVVAVAQGTNLVHERAMVDPAIMARLLTDVRAGYADGGPAYRYDPGLSPRLLGVLDGVVSGMTNREIGAGEGLAEQTIKHHVSTLMRAFNARDRIGILRQALLRGWAAVGPEPAPFASGGRDNDESIGIAARARGNGQWSDGSPTVRMAPPRDVLAVQA